MKGSAWLERKNRNEFIKGYECRITKQRVLKAHEPQHGPHAVASRFRHPQPAVR